MRSYTIIKKLRAGETVDFEGVAFRMVPGDLELGDTYIAERNVGPKLLTVRNVVKETNILGGFVCPVENAYPYDLQECVKVEMVET